MMHIETSGLRRFLPFGHAKTTASFEELGAKKDAILTKYPLRNNDVWAIIVGKLGSLPESAIAELLVVYEATQQQLGHVAVSELAKTAGLQSLSRDPFLRVVSFNYDSEIGAKERYQVAIEELKKGERDSIDYTDPEFISIGRKAEYDFLFMTRAHMLESMEVFNPDMQSSGHIYSPGTYRDGWNRISNIVGEYTRNLFPLLDSDEIIKAGNPSVFFGGVSSPQIVRRYL